MNTSKPIVVSQARTCTDGSCRPTSLLNRRSIVQGAAFGAAGLALGGFHPAFVAQDGAMIDNLNLGSFGGGSNPQINFNPFSPNALAGGAHMFESLYIVNDYSCEEVP